MKIIAQKIFSHSKKLTLISLMPVTAVLIGLSLSIGLRELTLPYLRQIDELRLSDPERIKLQLANSARVSDDVFEKQILNVLDCRTRGGENCSQLVKNLISADPANGRLWLEYSRSLAQEKGLDDSSIFALRKSYQLSGREGWIANTRTKFALSVWLELPADVREMTTNETVASMEDYKFIGFLADLYIENPISRTALKDIVQTAAPIRQKSFLALIDKKSKL